MKISRIRAKELTPELEEKWSFLQQDDSDFASPFFCPEFITTLGMYRKDIYVGLLKENDEIKGFFPFRRDKYCIAKPVPMCDYQGIIIEKNTSINLKEILKGLGLVAWDFEQLITSQMALQRTDNLKVTEIRTINLSQGYEAYENNLRRGEPERLNTILRKIRKLEREIGTLEFKAHISEMNILHTLLKWKAAKYNQGKKFEEWVTKTLETILLSSHVNFKGALSALYAGRELLAAHFGLCSGEILHWWFPAYNPAFEKYSPGTILLLKMAQFFSSSGIELIDLGAGDEEYKRHFSNDVIQVAQGSFELLTLVTAQRRFIKNLKTIIRRQLYLRIPLKKFYQAFKKE